MFFLQDNQDATTSTTESLGKFCGSSASVFPPQIATAKRFAVVRFASDASVAHNGFRHVVFTQQSSSTQFLQTYWQPNDKYRVTQEFSDLGWVDLD